MTKRNNPTKAKRKRNPLVAKNQVLKKLHINNLRSCKELSISFEPDSVTGIFGLNGCGKSTILQALVGIFRSDNSKENTKLSRFFKYTSSTNRWKGSKFSAFVDYVSYSGKQVKPFEDKQLNYEKNDDEWTPRQATKPNRSVVFVPLSGCIPDIEKVSEDRVTFTPAEGDILDKAIANAASKIMKVKYEDLKINRINKLSCFTVKKNDLPCHSFNLGAGEQRLFRLLQVLFRVPDYSLIIIDELDLTLHSAALKTLVDIMCDEARKDSRHLQIVFSSHRQDLMSHRYDGYSVKFILNTPMNTQCLENPTEDCYELLSGDSKKILRIFVEDRVAGEIVKTCLCKLGLQRYATICRYGSITNSAKLASGFACINSTETSESISDIVFFTDGDNNDYKGDSLRSIISKLLTGGGADMHACQEVAFGMIRHFTPPLESLPPEAVIRTAICSMDTQDALYPQLISDSKAFNEALNHHSYIQGLEERGWSLHQIVDAFSQTTVWGEYVKDVMQWLEERKATHFHSNE